jgi:OmpA-OmpF porin, OOP family
MIRKLLLPMMAVSLLSACDSLGLGPSTTQAVVPPPVTTAPDVSYMLFFAWDSTALSDQGTTTISQAAAAYKERGASRVAITGFTDTTGSEAYNNQLAMRRGNVVRDALVRGGVPAAAITVTASGEQGLLVPTAQQVKEGQNRRVQVVLTK